MKVLKNYIYNASYQLLALILPLITTPYVSRVLGPNGVGINAYTNSIAQYFILLANLGIALYGNREIAYVREDKNKLTLVFWEIQCLKVVTTLISVFIFIILAKIYSQYSTFLYLQSINVIAVVFDISWLYMGIEDFKKTVIRNTLIKIVSIILIFLFVKDRSDVALYIFILAISTFLGHITLWPFLKDTLNRNFKFHGLRPFRHLKPTIALFVPQIATQIYLVLNKTMLGTMRGPKFSGYYNYSDSLIKMVLALATALGTVMLPHIANAFSNKQYERVNKLLYKSFDYVTAIATPMAFGLAGISHTLVPIFYGKGYYQVGTAMTIEAVVIILISWSGTIGTQFLLPINRVKAYTTSVMLGAITNIVLNIPLIYFYGLYGAMVATVISELIVTSYQINYVKTIVDLSSLFRYTFGYLFAGLVMFIPIFYLSITFKPTFTMLLTELVIGALIYIFFIVFFRRDIVVYAIEILNKRRRK